MTKFKNSIDARMEDLLAIAHNVCALVETTCTQKGKPCKIKFNIDQSLEFNAFAELLIPDRDTGSVFGGLYEVTVNMGVIYKLAYYFEMATSIYEKLEKDRSVNPLTVLVHNDQTEIAAKQLASPNFFDFDLDRDLFSVENKEGSFSKIEENFWPFWFHKRDLSDAAFGFLACAFQFLVLHECSHIARGHLEYLDAQTRVPAIPFADLTEQKKTSEEMVKAMEIDADQQALFAILLENAKKDMSSEVLLAFEGNLFALALLYGVFDLRVRTASTYVGASHPDPDLRYHLTTRYMMIALSGMTGRNYKDSLESIFQTVVRNVVRIQRELGVLGGGYSVYLAASTSGEAQRIFFESATSYFKNAIYLQEKWIHRIREDEESISKLLVGS